MPDSSRVAPNAIGEVGSALRLLDKSGRGSANEGSRVQREPSFRFGLITSLIYPKVSDGSE